MKIVTLQPFFSMTIDERSDEDESVLVVEVVVAESVELSVLSFIMIVVEDFS